jgi:osmotically-inducible protein OsmY
MKTDAQLQQDVMNELKWESTIHAAEIGVAVKDRVVTLSGNVDSYAKKRAAEQAVKRVAGVQAVAEEIKVKLANDYRRSDEDIARTASNILQWHSWVPQNRVKVMVQDGQVTLSGDVDWYHQKNGCGECRPPPDGGIGRNQLDHYQTAGADGESGRGEEQNRGST